MKYGILTSAILVLAMACPLSAAGESDEDRPRERPGLSIKQETISTELENLEQKVMRLVQQLRETDPDQAQRLTRALTKSREEMLRKRMEKISQLLNEVNLDTAVREQEEVINDLVELLNTLTQEEDYYDRLQKRIEELEEWREQINKLSREEWEQKRESEKFSNLAEAQKRLQEQIDRLKELRKRQADIEKGTEQARAEGTQNLSKMSQDQRGVRGDTEKLLADMSRQAGGESGASANKDARSAEPGETPLREATKQQSQSENKLASGEAASAEKAQENALAAMEQALKQLQQEKQRLESLSPDHPNRMAQKQTRTRRKTGELSKQMKPSQQGQSAESGSPGGARSSLQAAQKSMQQASGKLSKGQAQSAARNQEKAHDELQKAREKIDKELSELRKEQEGALLAKLIGMFQSMLENQERLTARTSGLDKKKQNEDWSRTESLACAEVSRGEKDIRETASEALTIMEENSSPVVFPGVVRGVIEDLNTLVSRLQEEKTGGLTPDIQRHVERTLRDLIEALEMTQENPPMSDSSPQEGQQGRGQKPPLINLVAELKLLRNMQKNVNANTRELADAVQAEKRPGPEPRRRLETLTERQKTIAQMAQEFREKLRRRFQREQKESGDEGPTL